MKNKLVKLVVIAARTSRTMGYIQNLIRYDLSPSHVLVLDHSQPQTESMPLEGQFSDSKKSYVKEDSEWPEASFDPAANLENILAENHISYEYANTKDINTQVVRDLITSRQESLFLFSGYGGVLVKDLILSTGKQFLHVHGGWLPCYKGSTTNYYSYLERNQVGAAAIFLTSNIDAGPVIVSEAYEPPISLLEFDHIYDTAIRSRVLIKALRILKCNLECDDPAPIEHDPFSMHFIIHPTLKHLAIIHSQKHVNSK